MRPRVPPGPKGPTRWRGVKSPDPLPVTVVPPQGDVVASTLANIDLRVTKATMVECTRRCEVLSQENEALRVQLREHEANAVKVVEYLREQLERLGMALTAQRSEVKRLLTDNANTEAMLRSKYERMLEERDEQVTQFASLTQRLQLELKASASYVHRREEFRIELQRLHNNMEEMKQKHETELSALRLQNVNRKVRLVALEESMQKIFQEQVEIQSARLFEEKSKAMLEDFDVLQQERLQLTLDVEQLLQLTTAKNMECTDMKRRGALQQGVCEETLRRIVKGNRRARESEIRTQRLEQRVRELQREKKTMQEELSSRYEEQIRELKKELLETRSSLQSHRGELRRLRHVASTVVDQRSDLERFFYVALNDVRRMRSSVMHRSQPSTARVVFTRNDDIILHHVQKQQLQPQQQRSQCPSPRLPDLQGPMFLTQLQPNVASAATVRSLLVTSGNRQRQHGNRGAKPMCDSLSNANFYSSGCSSKNALSVNLGESGEGAYLDEMSWEDKEKIIKALLFYINHNSYLRIPQEDTMSDEAMSQKSWFVAEMTD